MKRFVYIAIIVLLLSALILCTDSGKIKNVTFTENRSVLISQIETSFDGGLTRLPYGKYFYDDNDRIVEAIIWRYKREADGTMDSTEYTYTFARKEDKIDVTRTEWGDDVEYTDFFELKVNDYNQIVEKAKYDSGKKMEIVNYKWNDNDRLVQRIDPYMDDGRGDTTTLTYDLSGNIISHIAYYVAPAYPYHADRYRDSIAYEYNTGRKNVFALYPVELGILEEGCPEVYILGASENEVTKYVVNKDYISVDAESGDTVNVSDEMTGDYTFEYNEDDLPRRVGVDVIHRHKYRDADSKEVDDEYTSAYSMLFFSYIDR